MTFQRQRVFVNKMGVTLQDLAVVTLIKTLPHPCLLINHVVGMVENIGE